MMNTLRLSLSALGFTIVLTAISTPSAFADNRKSVGNGTCVLPIHAGIRVSGYDIGNSHPATSPAECCDLCSKIPSCKAFCYVNSRKICWLKTQATDASPDKDCKTTCLFASQRVAHLKGVTFAWVLLFLVWCVRYPVLCHSWRASGVLGTTGAVTISPPPPPPPPPSPVLPGCVHDDDCNGCGMGVAPLDYGTNFSVLISHLPRL